MFNILIVDDEVFTRESIIEQIPWNKLGITEIQQAYDGVNALEISSRFKPDILLTDVRMPRMDGIELSFKLREIYPSCEIIFMSGYSDKEYLKSAIKLKAISYVEKPIDIEELQTAIKNAIAVKSKMLKLNENIKKHIALQVITQNIDINELKELLGNYHFNQLSKCYFITILINIVNVDKIDQKAVLTNIEKIATKNDFGSISCFKDEKIILLHLYHNDERKFIKEQIEALCYNISQFLKQYSNFFICVGKKVSGILNIFESYQVALNNLCKTFFYDYCSIINCNNNEGYIYSLDKNVIEDFYKYLSQENKYESIFLIKRLTYELKKCTNTPVNYIKDIYYRLFLQLTKYANERNINLIQNDLNNTSTFEIFSSFCNIMEMEEYLIKKIEFVFNYLAQKCEYNTVSRIIKYIHDNYTDVNLSLTTISKNFYFSPAYVCKTFKKQTGKTINKYITELRLYKAKELLKDQNIKIKDIAIKVGYSDENYFTKLFKKDTGLTPSEYRRKILSTY
ncbi:response regulator transcription factor [Caldanaerobius polysaccharolyticus]|uniref:response regulator transcription factor n=1 Tax=Caldanaerobius polysaccharolyticus TaxID=44256 RepID=UPI00047CBA34|nr:response regulator [Caldanaerobius polysaccharolyticus]